MARELTDERHIARLIGMHQLDGETIRGLKSRLAFVEPDLRACTETLAAIWGGGSGNPEIDARDTILAINEYVTCPFCDGSGNRSCCYSGCYGGDLRDGSACTVCDGTGLVPCETCKGRGEV